MKFTSERNVKLALYTAMAGALGAGVAHAEPTPTTGLPVSSTANLSGGGEFGLDLDGDSNRDFYFYSGYSDGDCSFSPGYSYFYGEYSDPYGSNVAYYAGLVSGDSISDGLGDNSGQYYLANCTGDYGVSVFDPKNGGTRGYVGVGFWSSGNFHYGYLDLELVAQNGDLVTTLHAACFESTPGTPIQAGACEADEVRKTESVPVGGAIPLSLGVLALGAAALRRRRRQH